MYKSRFVCKVITKLQARFLYGRNQVEKLFGLGGIRFVDMEVRKLGIKDIDRFNSTRLE